MPSHLVGKAKEKNKIKTYQQKEILLAKHNKFVSIHCEFKVDEQDLKAGEGDDRIPISSSRSRSKKMKIKPRDGLRKMG